MKDTPETSMNVYPQIHFMKYFGQVIKKHQLLLVCSGLLIGGIFLALSFIQTFTSSTIFRFQVNNSSGTSLTSSIQLESLMGKTETIREKSFNYLNSIPFYFELGKELTIHPEGKDLIPVFLRSKNNILMRVKGLFYETFKYEGEVDVSLKVAQALQKIVYFKKNSDNAIIMYVQSGSPELSLKIGRLMGPMVRNIILNNESHDLQISAKHFKTLLSESDENLLRLNDEYLQLQEGQHTDQGKYIPKALMEMEKELRMSRIEVQRFDLMVKRLENEIKKNSVYSIANEEYKYVDQVSMERLSELKQQREVAITKAQSIEKSFSRLQAENADLPETEQIQMTLKWNLEIEQSINKDLLLKTRDIEGLLKLADNSVRVIGDTSLVPAKIKLSRPLRFVFGLILGILAGLIGIYYFYDFFKVIKGQHDLKTLNDGSLLTSIPRVKGKYFESDLWKELPSNHHVMESFRLLMETTIAEKSLCFVSSSKNEGKSFIISNLARNLNRFGTKVLVVDTNFRNSHLTKELSGVEGIKVISAELFKHDKDSFLDRSLLIQQIRIHSKESDVILIDTMSMSDSNDALIAASVANSIVVVASHLETYQHKFHEILNKVQAAGLTNYKLLLNKANSSDEIIKAQARGLDHIDSNTIYLRKSS